jgi:hypothetical protein
VTSVHAKSLSKIADALDNLSNSLVNSNEEIDGARAAFFWNWAADRIRWHSKGLPRERGVLLDASELKCAFALKNLNDAAQRLANLRVSTAANGKEDEVQLLLTLEDLVHIRLNELLIPLVAPDPHRGAHRQMAKINRRCAKAIQAIRGWRSRFPHLRTGYWTGKDAGLYDSSRSHAPAWECR